MYHVVVFLYIYIYGAYPGAYLVTCVSENLYIYVAATFWVYVDSSWVALFFDHTGIGIS